MNHKRVNKFTYLIAFIVLAGILLANGCAIETETQLQISTDEPLATDTLIIPTATEIIPTATEVPAYIVQDSFEVFTPAQEALNQSPEALAQQERFQRWLDYWVQFDNRPFALDSADIHWKYIYDNPQNPTEVIMLLEVGGPDYKNATFLPPHNADGPIDYPPEVSGSDIAPGLGPMEIDLNKDGTVTRAYQGTLARFDSQGNLVETLVGYHWEAESLIKGNIFQDPQSKAEFDTVVLAPSPIDEPEKFALWQDEYLKQVYEKLKTYTGPTISDEYTGIDYSVGRLMFISSEWPVISSYKFKFQNEELLTKTFVYMDKRNGELVPLSFTYPPEDSYFYENFYKNPEIPNENGWLEVSFLWMNDMKQLLPNDPMDALLPDTLDEFHYNSLIRFIQNTATPEEKDTAIKTMFVLTVFNPRP